MGDHTNAVDKLSGGCSFDRNCMSGGGRGWRGLRSMLKLSGKKASNEQKGLV